MAVKVAGVKVKRMNLNVPVDVHNAFKIATVLKNKDMTTVLLDFIKQYVAKHYPKKMSSKGRRA
jgi:hypothetical protein